MIKKRLTILFSIFICILTLAQKQDAKLPDTKQILKEVSETSCKCIDSINSYNKTREAINQEVHSCIDPKVLSYMLSKGLSQANTHIEQDKIKNKKVNVTINSNPESDEYKKAYYEIEAYLMKNCNTARELATTAESKHDKISNDPIAHDFYKKAIQASEKEDWNEAIKNYKSALEKDPKFVYAWDNLGICYRRTGDYDKALEAYKKSLAIDPKGKMPLQNIAITYIYKKEYQKAIDAYSDFDKIYPGDPEVYYGIGQIYYEYLKDNEKALNYICKAYSIYIEQKSPYRSDAETIIGYIYKKMKEENKLDKFKEILKSNKLNFE
ncbi:tetratricopeptide repeat protein [Chryseobacterium arthrosphaerae]|uniref:tetratricopeptide repeat protein n=1 Tax=Chryseobacterium arthrosphaerae TaxID=651561 RepID=UPI000F50B5DF|nr:tetratricopeptide repeat protein [Chryseobacterium arthrosphaerae]AYZ11441.1 tetratricopeptide repeat protein [Chryseobacterium arthrosphaerae]